MRFIIGIVFLFNIWGTKISMDENERVNRFLKVISQIESSGGKNFQHPEMQQGIHKGHSGIGRYGLMPNTVNEVLNRMRLNGSLNPELANLRKLDPVKLKETLESNPQIEDQIAQSLAERVLTRIPDEEMAAFSWNQGHNMTPDQISQKKYKDHDYVRKYNLYKELTNSQPNPNKIAMGDE
jgi:hypothetical protein